MQLQQWLRIVLVGIAAAVIAGGGIFAYRYFTTPTTLTVAVGTLDGAAAQMMSSIAGRLTKTGSSIRLKVMPVESASEAAKQLSAGKVDLAIIRADSSDLSDVRTVVLMAHSVALLVAPAGSTIDSIDALSGKTIGI